MDIVSEVDWIGGGAADNMSTGVVSVKNSGRHLLTRRQTLPQPPPPPHHHHHLLLLHHSSGELKSIFAPPFPCFQFQQHRRQQHSVYYRKPCVISLGISVQQSAAACGTISYSVLSSRLPFYGRKRPRRRLVNIKRKNPL
jgi:hypothetical protein